MELLHSTPVGVKEIQEGTRTDVVLSQVVNFVQHGWPSRNKDEALQPYFERKQELIIQDGCLLWGNCVVVPPKARERMMEELHETHPGICRMKSLARGHVWWPKMGSELEMKVRSILDPSAYGFGNAPVSSGKLCAGVAKIWLFGPHSACSLIQPKLFAISASSRSVVLLRY